MSLMLDVTPAERQQIEQFAFSEGVSVTEYVRRRILLPQENRPRYQVSDFAGVSHRTPAEIDAHIAEIEAARNDWDRKESAF